MKKFKDLQVNEGLDTLADLSVAIGTLLLDDGFSSSVDEIAKIYADNKPKLKRLVKPVLMKFIPLLAKKYRKELYSIVAVIDGTSQAELQKLSIVEFINKVFAILNDDDFLGFFTLSNEQGQKE